MNGTDKINNANKLGKSDNFCYRKAGRVITIWGLESNRETIGT